MTDQSADNPLQPVINATGILIHTGLGRAPLADRVAASIADIACRYAPVELELTTGRRGARSDVVRSLLCELTGAESATVTNNNAASVMLVLSTVASGRGVLVSRGELIEIGGSFRLPEVVESGGAVLRAVGTTNRTCPDDYERAIDETTAAILKMHTSNYVIEGETSEVGIEELVELGRRHGVPVIHDIGSGVLRDPGGWGLPSHEPDAVFSIAAGADLVLFSGDKLLGGPQAGIIVGRRAWIERIEKNPFMRAVRVGKLILAGLRATLELYRDPESAGREIPVLRALAVPIADLENRARDLADRLRRVRGVTSVVVEPSWAYVGGGSVPGQSVPSVAVGLRPSDLPDEELAARLRRGHPGVVPRTRAGLVWFDLRTVFADEDGLLVRAVENALAGRGPVD